MKSKRRKLWLAAIVVLALLAGVAYKIKQRLLPAAPLQTLQPGVAIDAPSPLATWPWPDAKKDTPHPGVTHWLDTSSSDGTTVELFDFDFGANPRLRFEIFDQDEDDRQPFDNQVNYWPRGVGLATRQLNARFQADGRGVVVAAWNGLFFGYGAKQAWAGGRNIAFHVSPVVLRGKAYFTKVNHRWAFGVKYVAGKPVFKALFKPDAATLEREFDFGGGSAQCLIRDGQPLRLQPFPQPGATPLPQPVPATPQEAGHIPDFDHMKSCRAALGWTKDNRHLFLLFVKEPDAEAGSIVALHHRWPVAGGWMVADLQRFWQAKGVWGAINSDAGDVAQLAYRLPGGNYLLVPPRQATPPARLVVPPAFPNPPQGGAMMYFYVRDGQT